MEIAFTIIYCYIRAFIDTLVCSISIYGDTIKLIFGIIVFACIVDDLQRWIGGIKLWK